MADSYFWNGLDPYAARFVARVTPAYIESLSERGRPPPLEFSGRAVASYNEGRDFPHAVPSAKPNEVLKKGYARAGWQQPI